MKTTDKPNAMWTTDKNQAFSWAAQDSLTGRCKMFVVRKWFLTIGHRYAVVDVHSYRDMCLDVTLIGQFNKDGEMYR